MTTAVDELVECAESKAYRAGYSDAIRDLANDELPIVNTKEGVQEHITELLEERRENDWKPQTDE